MCYLHEFLWYSLSIPYFKYHLSADSTVILPLSPRLLLGTSDSACPTAYSVFPLQYLTGIASPTHPKANALTLQICSSKITSISRNGSSVVPITESLKLQHLNDASSSSHRSTQQILSILPSKETLPTTSAIIILSGEHSCLTWNIFKLSWLVSLLLPLSISKFFPTDQRDSNKK